MPLFPSVFCFGGLVSGDLLPFFSFSLLVVMTSAPTQSPTVVISIPLIIQFILSNVDTFCTRKLFSQLEVVRSGELVVFATVNS